MRQSTVWRLLRRNISAAQLTGFWLANLVGLSIVITAIQFYTDISGLWDTDDSFISRDYIIISKKISGMGSLFGTSTSCFSEADIADIDNQPWVRRTGKFTASGFNVSASVEMGGRGMSTALFLESIPSEFFDITPPEWDYDSVGDTEDYVPIILSKEYLSLYNFGFASSRGLPQVSESMMGMVPLRLSISGNGRQQYFKARIVGFSSRLNTIAVPENFMRWANATFADSAESSPSRLIIEVNSPGNPEIADYLEQHGYESSGDKVDNGRAAYFLTIATIVVVSIGAVISLLAFFILLLSINLLLQKNRRIIRSLLMLGYTPPGISKYYCRMVAVANVSVLSGAILIMYVAKNVWQGHLAAIGVAPATIWPAVCAAVVIVAAITAGNLIAISRSIHRTFPSPQNRQQARP